ncbi:ATP-binding protein, partial [Oligoflexia bacterium]|nr:ATP-binding protein [Oligoflexia bacterium]
THFENVGAGIDHLYNHTHDLIITDLNLPDTTGVEHVKKFRSAGGDTPIIVLTSSTSLLDAVEAMKLGAQDFIVKNFDGDFREGLGLSLSRVFSTVQLEEERRKLQQEMEILQVAISNSQDGLAVVDEKGKVQYSNSSFDAFIKLCGGQRGDALSICSSKVNKFEVLLENLKNKLQQLPDGAVWNTEVSFVDDKEKAFDLSLSVVSSGAMEAKHFSRDCVMWVRDISEQKRREKFQREILSTTTHDLKGPLGAVITGTELLADLVEGQDKASMLVLRVSSAAHGVVNLIDEFLSARRIKEGNFILKPSQQKLSELIAEVKRNYDTISEARSIALTFDVQNDEAEVAVDRLGFARVLGNLLSNALKFTPKGGSVFVRLWVDTEFHVQIGDTGSGMEPSEAQRIFERFSRLEKHKDYAGSGIGLFVVRCIVEAHGGSIAVTSKVGQGTTFDIVFPLNPPVNERGELISLDFA